MWSQLQDVDQGCMFLPKKTACVVVSTYNESDNLRICGRDFRSGPFITEYELHVVVVMTSRGRDS